MLDTNICSYIISNRPPEVREHFSSLKSGQAAMSVVTWGEMILGVEKNTQIKLAIKLETSSKTAVRVIPMEPDSAKFYGVIRAFLETQGTLISTNDIWIAAHAMSCGHILVTNNEKEFSRVPGLRRENWVLTPSDSNS
ncbi:MAG: type II toxin-antitoxin system VapC family toxin [Deltaproteobacteria bacterium]|nr:type II toxin-antitoxin system VapC family toxin [Deltaproteobacteria bacterium]